MATSKTVSGSAALVARLIQARFVANEEDVTQLASAVQSGSEANGAYTQVLLVECQSRLGPAKPLVRGRRPIPITMEAQIEVLNSAHQRFYPYVLLGVGPADLGKAELARRATFARSAKATLMAVVRAGIDLRPLDPMEITKAKLRQLARGGPPGEPGGGGEEAAEGEAPDLTKTIQRGERMMLNALTLLAAQDHVAAVAVVGRIAEALDRIVPLEEALEASSGKTEATSVGTIVGHRLQRSSAGAQAGR